jgi:glycosyltransferase involved in cell wall biosynthesis
LSVIVPVYNECGTVAECLERVSRVPVVGQIVVVDDGSTDGTRDILRQYEQRPGFVVRYHERNYGKGHAIRTGLEKVVCPVVVIQDADLEYDPDDFVAMLEPITAGRARVVYGSRRLRKENRQHAGFIYFLGGMVMTYWTRLLFGLRITDEATCYKMLQTDLLRSLHLTCERFEFCPEVTAKLAKLRVPILDVPIRYAPRHKSEGKKIGLADAFEGAWTLLKFRFRR